MRANRFLTLLLLGAAVVFAAACGSGDDKESSSNQPAATAVQGRDAVPTQQAAANPIDQVDLGSEKILLVFWHTQTGPNEAKLKSIIQSFQAKYPNITIDAQFQNSYDENYKKLKTAIVGGGLPDISVAYPSEVSEYQVAGKVVVLDDYITSQKHGFTKAELEDFIPSFLTESQYPQYGNKYLSFPFTKSALVMYYNADKLKAENIKVPETWDEFRAASKKLSVGDAKGHAIAVDASTFKGMIFSRGGKVITEDGKKWLFNEQPGVDSLTLIQEMVKEGSAYHASKRFADQEDFGAQRTFFTFGSTSGFNFYNQAVGGKFQWSVATIPHGTGAPPATVLYGASIAMFKSTPQKQLASWLFVKHFSSPEVTADWATSTGYMPVRKSAQQSEVVKKRIEQVPAYGVALNQVIPVAKPEESVLGSQDTRNFIADAIVGAITDTSKNPKALLDEAHAKAQRALQQ